MLAVAVAVQEVGVVGIPLRIPILHRLKKIGLEQIYPGPLK